MKYNARYEEYIDYLERVILSSDGDKLPPIGLLGDAKPTTADLKDAIERVRTYRKDHNNNDPPKVWFCKEPNVYPPEDPSGWTLTGLYHQDYQDTGYTCGPSSAQMVFSALGYNFSESQIAALAGTTTAGTAHHQLYTAMRKLVPTLDIAEYYLSDIGFNGIIKKLQIGCELILHIRTGKLKTDADGNRVWTNDYGHYIFLVGVHPSKKRVRIADPTKGVKEFTYQQITNAINAVLGQKSVMVFYRPS